MTQGHAWIINPAGSQLRWHFFVKKNTIFFYYSIPRCPLLSRNTTSSSLGTVAQPQQRKSTGSRRKKKAQRASQKWYLCPEKSTRSPGSYPRQNVYPLVIGARAHFDEVPEQHATCHFGVILWLTTPLMFTNYVFIRLHLTSCWRVCCAPVWTTASCSGHIRHSSVMFFYHAVALLRYLAQHIYLFLPIIWQCYNDVL